MQTKISYSFTFLIYLYAVEKSDNLYKVILMKELNIVTNKNSPNDGLRDNSSIIDITLYTGLIYNIRGHYIIIYLSLSLLLCEEKLLPAYD